VYAVRMFLSPFKSRE